MTLRHFKIFISVCDNMNMTAASQSLYISQSAVSQAISELEFHYGLKLFERLNKKLYITEAGGKLLGYARHLISLDDSAEKEMRLLHDNGQIRLGSSVTIGSYLLPKLVSAFMRSYPKIDIEVFIENTQTIENLILSDKVDLGVVEGDVISDEIIVTPFMDDDLVLICNKTHKFNKMKPISLSMLEQEPFIVREPGSGTRKVFETVMAVNDIKWRPVWTCNNSDAVKTAVIEGIGISVISKRAVIREASDGDIIIVPIPELNFTRTFKLVYHKNKFVTPFMKNFIELCLKTAPDYTL